MSEPRSDRAGRSTCFAVILAVAIVAQTALIIGLERPSSAHALVTLAVGVLVGLVTARLWTFARRGKRSALAMTLVTASLGGLGMLCGALIDEQRAQEQIGDEQAAAERDAVEVTLPPCHAALVAEPRPREVTSKPSGHGWLVSWMNLLMLAVCVPACLLSCRCAGPWVHAASGLGMVAGMAVGGAWLGPALASWLSPELAAHLAMLVGMSAGTAIAAAASLHSSAALR